MQHVVIFAHRGASGYCPENTMAAFREAVRLGATGIETDVQMTKDGHLVLIHDETLLRTAGVNRWVYSCTLEELRRLDAGAWYGEEFRGEKIPTLEELLNLAAQHDLILNLELKNSIVAYPELERRTAELVRIHRLTERVIVSSFNHDSLLTMKKEAPEIETAVLYTGGLAEPVEYARRLGASALHPHHFLVRRELVEKAASAGIRCHPFTVNGEPELRRLIAAGVSGIITDYPDRLAALLNH